MQQQLSLILAIDYLHTVVYNMNVVELLRPDSCRQLKVQVVES